MTQKPCLEMQIRQVADFFLRIEKKTTVEKGYSF
jgi:hypothetical protein